MRIGVPREIKIHEYRVGLVPSCVRELTDAGHEVLVETEAGAGIGCSDADYVSAGATIAKTADEVFASTDLIVGLGPEVGFRFDELTFVTNQ